MTSESNAAKALQETALAQTLVVDNTSILKDEDVRREEFVEVVVGSDNEPDTNKDVETDTEDTEHLVRDGGARAWLQVIGSFLVFSNIWGFTLSFGAFESYYEISYIPDTSASAISWIGTVANFLLIFGGILTGPLFDKGYFRTMLLTGAFIETLAVFLLSLCPKYWQIVLTQGIMIGIGTSFLYMPGLALVGRSFKKHRSAAMAVATSGAPVGGVAFTLVFQQLNTKLSCIIPITALGVHNIGDLSTGPKQKLFDRQAFLDLPFVVYTVSNFMVFFGYLVPFFFMSTFGQIALGMSSTEANYSIIIAQATSIVGRLAAGYYAARLGNIILWLICALSSGILCIAWIGVHSKATFLLIVALFGCMSGPLISLPPSAFVIVCPDPKVLGTRLGMTGAIGAFASLIGSPIAAAISDSNGSNKFLGLQLFSGLCMTTGGCMLIGLWIILIKRRGGSKLI